MNKLNQNNLNILGWYLSIIVVFIHIAKLFYNVYDNNILNWSGFAAICGLFVLFGYSSHDFFKSHDRKNIFSYIKKPTALYFVALFLSMVLYLIFERNFKVEFFYNFIFFQHIFDFETIETNESLWIVPYMAIIYIHFLVTYKSKFFKFLGFCFVIFLLLYLNNPYYLIFYIFSSLGAIFSYYNINLFSFKLPFFSNNNHYQILYLFHYPVFIFIHSVF